VSRLSESDDRGYILVALLIGVAIASIWMAAALPVWRQQATREKEAELIFRGEQYARAIYLYGAQVGRPGALPASFDDLLSQHVLRRKWKDPITNDEFLPKAVCGASLNPNAPPANPSGPAPRSGGAGRSALTAPAEILADDFPRPDVLLAAMQTPPVGPPPSPAPVRGGGGAPVPAGGARGQGQRPGTPGPNAPTGTGIPQAGQGICGVQSKSHDTSIRIYNGQQEYDLWQFDVNSATQQFSRNVAKLAGGSAAVPGAGVPGSPTGGGFNGVPAVPGTGVSGRGGARGFDGAVQPSSGTPPGRGGGRTTQPGGLPPTVPGRSGRGN
jgi:type II secretory pathway pseudopilin PulG